MRTTRTPSIVAVSDSNRAGALLMSWGGARPCDRPLVPVRIVLPFFEEAALVEGPFPLADLCFSCFSVGFNVFDFLSLVSFPDNSEALDMICITSRISRRERRRIR